VQHEGTGATNPYTDRLTADTLVIWHTLSSDDYNSHTVTLAAKSQDSRVAGVLAAEAVTQEPATNGNSTDASGNTAAEDLGKDNWTWLQTYGAAEVTIGKTCKGPVGALLGTSNVNDMSGTAGAVQLTADLGSSWADLPVGANKPNIAPTTQFGIAGFFMEEGSPDETDVSVFIRTE
jgi:hypothetical protein